MTSLASTLERVLRNAADAHHVYVESLDEERAKRENENWTQFYAEYMAHALAPLMAGLQAARTCDVKQHADRHVTVDNADVQVLHAKARFEGITNTCTETGTCKDVMTHGAGWFAEAATVPYSYQD